MHLPGTSEMLGDFQFYEVTAVSNFLNLHLEQRIFFQTIIERRTSIFGGCLKDMFVAAVTTETVSDGCVRVGRPIAFEVDDEIRIVETITTMEKWNQPLTKIEVRPRCMTARDRLRAWDVNFFGSSNLTHKSCGIFVASWGFADFIGTRLVFHNFLSHRKEDKWSNAKKTHKVLKMR